MIAKNKLMTQNCGHCRFLFIALCIISFCVCCAAIEDREEKREPSNLENVRTILLAEACQDSFIGSYDLNYFGTVHSEITCFHLYVFLREFGNKRLTKRLIILSHDLHYLGMYEIPELPKMVDGNVVMFPLEEKWGNKIVFKGDHIPQEIYLDGESYTFFRGDEK